MATTSTYEARVKLPNGSSQKVQVQADSVSNARAMIEAQYGKQNLIGSVVRV
jgi:hypothetical protein